MKSVWVVESGPYSDYGAISMKSVMLLIILISLLAFHQWWSIEPGKSTADIPTFVLEDVTGVVELFRESPFYFKEDWECTRSVSCELRCQLVYVFPDGGKYYTSDHKMVDDPTCTPEYRDREQDRFPVYEI